MKRGQLVLFGLGLWCCLFFTGRPLADEPKAKVPSDLEGKYLLVTLKGAGTDCRVLEKAELRRIDNETFLVGFGVDAGKARKSEAGVSVWVALHDVATIQAFPSVAKLNEAVAPAAKDPEKKTEPGDPAPAKRPAYEIRTTHIGKTKLALVRFRVDTGEAWVLHDGTRYEKVGENDAPPAGNYEVMLISSEEDWSAFRVNRTTGATWMMQNNRWVKIKEPEVSEPIER